MRLNRLWLTDIRCYAAAELAPAPGLTAIIGDNGQGKTSLLEAAAWLAIARSFRGAPDAAVVRGEVELGYVRGEVERAGREQLVEIEIARRGRNRIQVNRQTVARGAALSESVRVTLFSPDDLELVKGGPGLRRSYLDEVAGAVAPGADATLHAYERVVRQRTALLRAGVRSDEDRHTQAVWDDQLVVRGAEVVRNRLVAIDHLEGPLEKAYGDLASMSPAAAGVEGRYEPAWVEAVEDLSGADVEGLLRRALEREGRRERDRGQTLVGPHRDEWRLMIGGLDARTHASQGEQRTLALALRLAAHSVVATEVGEPPILLLDDVFSELDPNRSRALVDLLAPGQSGQALVTTASVLPDSLEVELRIRVHDGVLEYPA